MLAARPAAQHMHATMETEQVRVGDHEFVPRFAQVLPKSLVVPPGQTVVLPPDSTWDAIEISGTLVVSRDYDTTVRFTHLLILPGGRLEAGTAADPLQRRAEFVVRDVPLDVHRDPYQWGNGIVNFGTQTRVGLRKTTFTETVGDVSAGATSLTLAEIPEGWQVGDELLLPDTRQPAARTPIRRESPVTIASISGATVTLSKPLDFEHLAIRDPDGRLILRPRVANFTRNIVLRSENPQGTRGHTVNMGPAASWDIRYNQFVGLGRTQAADLDNTEVDDSGRVVRIGTNQIAKYASHDHHTGTSLATRSTVGNAFQGTGGAKWAHVVHASHDTLVEDNVCADFQAGCFVTEDGYEVRNVLRHNLAAYSPGNGRSTRANTTPRTGNSPGGEGSGFWLRGVANTFDRNESWNNKNGFNLFNTQHVGVGTEVPAERGGGPEVVYDRRRLAANVPVSFTGNVSAANGSTGFEYWSMRPFAAVALTAAHNGARQLWAVNSQNNSVQLRDVTMIAAGGSTKCIDTSQAYTSSLEVDGGMIKGCAFGVDRGGAIEGVILRDLEMQNRINVRYTGFPGMSLFENVLHSPLGDHPKQYFVFGTAAGDWQPDEPLPINGRALWAAQRGSAHVIRNWQGTGQDYRVFTRHQLRSAHAWPSRVAAARWFTPVEGLSMGESWDRYGLAFLGDVVDDAAAVELEGLVNGVARAGLDVSLPPPRLVLTYPNMIRPAEFSRNRDGSASVRLELVMTGDPTGTNERAVVAIDDEDPVRVEGGSGGKAAAVSLTTRAGATPGMHQVRTWRENQHGRKIDESVMTFAYCVADEVSCPTGDDPSSAALQAATERR
jgi:hypothetical protein